MTVTSIDKDAENLTMTLTADFDASVDRVWDLWADARKLEKWWGPPTYPATFTVHELVDGGSAAYYMTGPEGDRHHGWWRVTQVEPGKSLHFLDGFADAEGNPTDQLPHQQVEVQVFDHDDKARMRMTSTFASKEDMDRLMEMGMDEGLSLAVGQMDALLGL